jgi:hypothetical protein
MFSLSVIYIDVVSSILCNMLKKIKYNHGSSGKSGNRKYHVCFVQVESQQQRTSTALLLKTCQ